MPAVPGHELYNCRCRTVTGHDLEFEEEPRQMRVKNPETGEYEVVNEMTYEQWYKAKQEENPEAFSGWVKAGKNYQADQREYAEYQQLLGKKAPKTFASYQNMKYNSSEEWKALQGLYVSAAGKKAGTEAISARNGSYGKPNLVNAGASLSKRQETLLSALQNDGDSVTVSKKSCSMKDLAALTAHEGVEFAMLTKSGQRMIFRGNDHHVNALNGESVPGYQESGWKWSGHTHVYGGVLPSDGDVKILRLFKQCRSVIYDYTGNWGMLYDKKETD